MHAEATFTLEAAYYNETMAIWEPLIEPVEYKDDFKPWQLNVQVLPQIVSFHTLWHAQNPVFLQLCWLQFSLLTAWQHLWYWSFCSLFIKCTVNKLEHFWTPAIASSSEVSSLNMYRCIFALRREEKRTAMILVTTKDFFIVYLSSEDTCTHILCQIHPLIWYKDAKTLSQGKEMLHCIIHQHTSTIRPKEKGWV